MTPLSPSHLLAAAWPFLGMTCESPNGRDPLLQLMFRALGRPTNGSWSPAFVHHVGYWSHFDIGGEWSAWPLPATNDPDDLAKFALVRGIDAPTPARGDVYLRWSPTTERHVRAGIIARVEESFSHPVTGMLCWWCRTIEGNTTDRGAPDGPGIHVVRRRVSVENGDLFIRWPELDARQLASDPVGNGFARAGRGVVRRVA